MRALIIKNKKISLVEDLSEPDRKKGEVKVHVHYTSLNPTDADIVRGKLDVFFRLSGANSPVRTGLEFSGTVLESGGRYSVGDRVFGYTHLLKGPKTHQEVISIPEDYIAAIPDTLTFAEAAAFPLGAQTSLVALRQVAKLQSGQSILINGASGGLGVFAIQIARNMGANVTAVSGPSGQDTMTALGAHAVINYQETHLSEIYGTFDVIFELSGKSQFKNFRKLLAPNGIFIPSEPQKDLLSLISNPLRRQKVGYLYVDRGDGALLGELAQQVADKSLTVGHYREFSMNDFQDAFEALKFPGRIGRIVLRLR